MSLIPGGRKIQLHQSGKDGTLLPFTQFQHSAGNVARSKLAQKIDHLAICTSPEQFANRFRHDIHFLSAHDCSPGKSPL